MWRGVSKPQNGAKSGSKKNRKHFPGETVFLFSKILQRQATRELAPLSCL